MVFHAKLLSSGGQIMGLTLSNNDLTTALALDVPNQVTDAS